MTDVEEVRGSLCRQCKSGIPNGAKICSTCNSYQDWRGFVPFSNTALALIAALISVIGFVGPATYKIFHAPISNSSITLPTVDGTTLRVVAVNRGDASAALGQVWVQSDLLAGATKIRLRNDSDAIIPPGSKLLTFDIIPLMDEGESYQESMKIMSLILENKSVPKTDIRFKLFQSNGDFCG